MMSKEKQVITKEVVGRFEPTITEIPVYMVSVDYDEFKPETYRGVVFSDGTEELKRWKGVNYNQDYSDAMTYLHQQKITPIITDSVHRYNQDVAAKR